MCCRLQRFLIKTWVEIFNYTSSLLNSQHQLKWPLLSQPQHAPTVITFQANYNVLPRSETLFLNEKLSALTLMATLTVFSNIWVKVTMKGKKCPGASVSLSSATGNLISHSWCVSSGGISLGFKNSLFWAREASPLAALLHDRPLLMLTQELKCWA